MINAFKKNGYVIIDSRTLEYSTQELSGDIVNFIKNAEIFAYADLFAGGATYRNLGELIYKAYEHDLNGSEYVKKLFEFIYTIPHLHQFGSKKSFLNQLNALGIHSPTIGVPPVVRIDRPGDQKFSTPWHQDYWYSFSEGVSITAWAPLSPMEDKMGYLRVVPESHHQGLVLAKNYINGHEPYELLDPIDESKTIQIEVKFGEILIFNQKLLHKSGENNSNQCRVSMQLRYNDLHKCSMTQSSYIPVTTKFVKDNQDKYFLKASLNEI